MSLYYLIVLFLLSSADGNKLITFFAQKKCRCFKDEIRLGELKKKEYNKETAPSDALFGATAINVNLDSCAYSLLTNKERAYIDKLDSTQLADFQNLVNRATSLNCKLWHKHKPKL